MKLITTIYSGTSNVIQTVTTLQGNWVVNVSMKFGLFFFVASFVLITWRFKSLPPAVPLWYSKPWGTDQLAQPFWLFLLPISSLFWQIVDIVIVTYQKNQYRIFTQALFLSTFLVNFLSFVTLVKILFLVT